MENSKVEKLKEEKIREYFRKWKGWEISKDKKKISKTFYFKDFKEIIDFLYEIFKLGQKIKHYPFSITIQFPRVKIDLTTQEIEGISEKDFVLVKEMEDLANWKVKFYQWLGSPKIIAILIIIFFIAVFWHYFKYLKNLF